MGWLNRHPAFRTPLPRPPRLVIFDHGHANDPRLAELEDYAARLLPNLAMGATFGLYHLIYAACVWRPAARPRTE